jgi:tetratricopeptide (TPR) repeat protein
VAIPACLVAAWAFTRPALVDDGQPRADRVADGAWFALVLVAGAAVVALAVVELRRRPLGPVARRKARLPIAALAIAAVLVGGALLATNAGRLADEFRGGEVTNDPGRLRSLSSNNRLEWWREARSIFEAQPITGAGANTFEVARKRYRENASAVSQPHSVPLQMLAGTGIVGLALFLSLVGAAGVAAVGGLRRLEGDERDAAVPLAVALVLWLVHALVDYDWDFVAVTGPVLFAAGVLAAAGRPPRRALGLFAAAAAAAFALAAIVSIATPWLAERELREVNAALDRGDVDAAARAVDRARSLDPVSLGPVFADARVEEQRRRDVAAHEVYLEATRLQPKNPESWLQLGLYEFDIGDRCGAYRHLNEAYTLDPAGKQWTPGGPLVVSLKWVNAGNCG